MIYEGYLHIISLVLVCSISAMLVVISWFMVKRCGYLIIQKSLETRYNDFISEIIVCESKEEVESFLMQQEALSIRNKLLNKRFGRKVFIKELVKARNNLTGVAAANLQFVYETFGLDQDSLRDFDSEKWFKKAAAIQQLSRLNQTQYLKRIYKETNNQNSLVRNEAQIAVVKLMGFPGLRFLNIINYPVTQWQQLCLLQQLDDQDVDSGKMKEWLQSSNECVVEFALRLIEKFKCYDLHQIVIDLLRSTSATVRQQALHCLKEIPEDNTVALIVEVFRELSKSEKLQALEIIQEHGKQEQLNFLTTLVHNSDESIRFHALNTIEKISPAWRKMIEAKSIKNARVVFLDSPKKEIV